MERESMSRSFSERLSNLFPNITFVAFGLFMGWFSLLYGGRFWASDIETAGDSISLFFVIMSFSAMLALAIAGALPFARKMVRVHLFEVPLVASVVSAIGAVFVVLSGPMFLESFAYDAALVPSFFIVGSVAVGVGFGLIALCCGCLFGVVDPKKAFLYTALSYLLSSMVYFVDMGGPSAAPFSGGPTWFSMGLFVGLPFIAAFFFRLGRFTYCPDASYAKLSDTFPRGQGAKLLVMVAIFAAASFNVRMSSIYALPVDETIEVSALLQLVRIVVCVALILFITQGSNYKRNLSDVYSKSALIAAVLLAVVPAVGGNNVASDTLVGSFAIILDIAVWGLLAFVSYQRSIDPLVVFGLGYGSYMLGCFFGSGAALSITPLLIAQFSGSVYYMVVAAVLLVAGLVVFSGKDLEALTYREKEGSSLLETLNAENPLIDAPPARSGIFESVVQELSQERKLSLRESEVLALLAKGLSNDAIAEELFVSRNTVRTHVQNIYGKTAVHSRQDLMALVNGRVQAKKASLFKLVS